MDGTLLSKRIFTWSLTQSSSTCRTLPYRVRKFLIRIDMEYVLQHSILTGVTMTLFCTHGHVSGPNSLLDHEVIAPCGYSVPCQF